VSTAPARHRAFFRSTAIVAAVLALGIHASVASAVYLVIRSLHVFVAAHPRQVQGDGAMSIGAIDHDGNDQRAGEAGGGSFIKGWSPPLIEAAAMPPLDMQAEQETPNVAPPPAAPPDLVMPEVPAAQPVLAAQHSIFGVPPPPAAPSMKTPAPRASETSAQPAVAQHKSAPSNGSSGVAAGFSGSVADNPGGLLRAASQGGSNGQGGASTGDGGSTVTGRPGTPAGIRGKPLCPDYPEECRERGETGRVVIDVDILADGRIASTRVVSDEGHPRLAQAALAAFVGREFEPATLDGRPVRSVQRRPFVFQLR
jgi:TonB family protein